MATKAMATGIIPPMAIGDATTVPTPTSPSSPLFFCYKLTKMYETSFRLRNDFLTGMHGIRADMITGITRDLMDGT